MGVADNPEDTLFLSLTKAEMNIVGVGLMLNLAEPILASAIGIRDGLGPIEPSAVRDLADKIANSIIEQKFESS